MLLPNISLTRGLLLALFLACSAAASATEAVGTRYIVEAGSSAAAERLVRHAGGDVKQELEIIHGVVARLSPAQLDKLRASAGVRVYANRAVAVAAAKTSSTLTDGTSVSSSTWNYQTNFPRLVGAATANRKMKLVLPA